MEKSEKIVVGISIGDLNGIGIEVILKTFQDKRMLDFCTPIIFGSTKTISFHKKKMNLETNLHGITSINQLTHNKVNILNIWKEEVPIEIGNRNKNFWRVCIQIFRVCSETFKDRGKLMCF